METAVEDASEVMSRIEHAIATVKGVASGELGLQSLGDEADTLFGLLQRLNRAKRWEDALRVARCMAVVAALIGRWIELLRSLRVALHAAEELGDPLGEAWALHELGTLHLVAGRHAEANRQLDRAREIRQQYGSRDIAVTNANLQALCQTLRALAPRRLIERLLDQLVRRPGLALTVAATLLVVGGAGGAELATLGSGEPPQAKVAFSFLPSTPHVGQEIVFSASATDPHDPAASYTWQWGDGDPATKRVQRHEYRSAGTYKVVLTVRDAHGREIGAIARSVTIQRPTIEHGPNAYFSFLPPSPTARKPVLFDASSSYDPRASIASYEWSFGDGESARGATASHAFAQTHTYKVALTVTDTDGRRNTLARTVMVTPGRGVKLQTSLALHCPTSHVRLGETATVSGTIKPARSDIPVKIIYLSSSGEEVVGTTHSAADGSYQTSYTPQAAGSWSVESSQAESLGYQESTSEPCTFSVANATGKPLNETRTTINCPPDHVRLGETVTVSGTIKPARSDIPVKVLYTAASGHASSKMATSQVGGFYTTSYMPEEEGAWSVRSSQAETGEYGASMSITCEFVGEGPLLKSRPHSQLRPPPPPHIE
jgi:PKD repeat protein